MLVYSASYIHTVCINPQDLLKTSKFGYLTEHSLVAQTVKNLPAMWES